MKLTTTLTKLFDFIGRLTQPDDIVFIYGLPYTRETNYDKEPYFFTVQKVGQKKYAYTYKRIDQNRFGVWIELNEYLHSATYYE